MLSLMSFFFYFFFFKHKTAYEMRISDWSSDVCSSDLCQSRRSNKGGIAVSGEIILHGEDIYVQLGLGIGSGREVMFRRVAGRQIGRASCRERVCQYV